MDGSDTRKFKAQNKTWAFFSLKETQKMKKLFSTILLWSFISTPAFSSDDLSVAVSRVIDGDTFEIIVIGHPISLQKIKVRMRGIDAPEIFSYQCKEELIKGLVSLKTLRTLIENRKVVLKNVTFDKFGGRVDADVFLFGTDISKILIEKQLVAPYSGKGSRPSWCP